MPMRRRLSELEDPRTIGLFRILLGVLLVADVASLWPHTAYLYGDAGVMPAREACSTGLRPASAMCILGGADGANAVLVVFTVSSLAFAVGLGTQVTKWTTAYLFWSVVQRNNLPLAGEQVFGNFLFLLCLSSCHAAYSVDNWRRCRRLSARGRLDDGDPLHATYRPVPAWPRWLMIGQLCLTYGVNGWAKTGPTWIEGTSLYYLLANDRWFRVPPWWLLATFGTNLLRLATWVALWFERLFPLVAVGLLFRRRLGTLPAWMRWPTSRWIWASLALVFTGSLILLVNLGWFVPATLAATLVLFRGEEVARIVDRLRSRPTRPAVPATHVVRSPTRTLFLTAFVGWHGFAMLTNARALPHLSPGVPVSVHGITSAWGRLTNTWQFWGMFSPNAPKVRNWLVVDVVDDAGREHAAPDSRALVGGRTYPYLSVDRRLKVYAKILKRERLRKLHARSVCRTWRDQRNRPPKRVVLSRWTWPLPAPGWMAAHGPTDPRPAADRYRRRTELQRFSCVRGASDD